MQIESLNKQLDRKSQENERLDMQIGVIRTELDALKKEYSYLDARAKAAEKENKELRSKSDSLAQQLDTA